MASRSSRSDSQTLAVLHVGFALTGVLHSIGGPLLPSLTSTFHLSDSQSGGLLSLYYCGTSVGALLCLGRYARLMTAGFLAVALACLGVAWAHGALHPLFLALGIAVGVPMSAVSMYTGRRFAERSAAPLTLLNFTWSIGALLAPLLAARVLVAHSYRAAYLVLAAVALACAISCGLVLQEPLEARQPKSPRRGISKVSLIALFAFLAFLAVGIENTSATWLATYAMRAAGTGAAIAAATSSLYWWGFLASRGLSSLVLLRADAMRVLQIAAVAGLIAAACMIGVPLAGVRSAAMLILGAALGPIFPLLLSRFFAATSNTADSRWVLSICGFGGGVVPWLTGSISGATGNLRFGLAVVPAALFVMVCMLPALRRGGAVPEARV